MFDRAAGTYDSIGPGFFAYFGKRLAESAGIFPGAKVLDVACGRGASLFEAAQAAGPAGKIVGIDLSASMVTETAADIARRGAANASAACMDAECLKFNDNYFDIVLAGFCVFFFPDPALALREIRRVLKPGGRVALTTWGKTDTRDWNIELAKKHLPPETDPKIVPHLVTMKFEDPAGIKEALALAGFRGIVVADEQKDFFYKSKDEWWQTQYSHGIRGTLEKVEKANGKDGLERFKKDAFAMLDRLETPDGYRQTMKTFYTTAHK